jgi:hypothetical protein
MFRIFLSNFYRPKDLSIRKEFAGMAQNRKPKFPGMDSKPVSDVIGSLHVFIQVDGNMFLPTKDSSFLRHIFERTILQAQSYRKTLLKLKYPRENFF